MKKLIVFIFILSAIQSQAQKTENIIIITTDGFRWQEVFKGIDPEITNNKKFNQATVLIFIKNTAIRMLRNPVKN